MNLILIENSTYCNNTSLKKRLIQEGYKIYLCELCGQDENWRGKKFSLILDHKNGIHNDNRINNLRFLCPNCNATLDTHCRGSKIYNRKQYNEKYKPSYVLITKYDICICGEKKTKKSNLCRKCSDFERKNHKKRKVKERPSIDILKEEIKELGYCGTGRKYGVSDNAIRKWLKQ